MLALLFSLTMAAPTGTEIDAVRPTSWRPTHIEATEYLMFEDPPRILLPRCAPRCSRLTARRFYDDRGRVFTRDQAVRLLARHPERVGELGRTGPELVRTHEVARDAADSLVPIGLLPPLCIMFGPPALRTRREANTLLHAWVLAYNQSAPAPQKVE